MLAFAFLFLQPQLKSEENTTNISDPERKYQLVYLIVFSFFILFYCSITIVIIIIIIKLFLLLLLLFYIL
jgi:succinate-acetate transporter protein